MTDVTRDEIKLALEVMATLTDEPSDLDMVSLIVKEYENPDSPLHEAVDCLLFAAIQGQPSIQGLLISKPLSFIIKVSPKLVSFSMFLFFLFNLLIGVRLPDLQKAWSLSAFCSK
jgi:hypothetical protein